MKKYICFLLTTVFILFGCTIKHAEQHKSNIKTVYNNLKTYGYTKDNVHLDTIYVTYSLLDSCDLDTHTEGTFIDNSVSDYKPCNTTHLMSYINAHIHNTCLYMSHEFTIDAVVNDSTIYNKYKDTTTLCIQNIIKENGGTPTSIVFRKSNWPKIY